MKPAWGSLGPSVKQLEATKLIGGPQRHTLLVGGSRSRKTFTIVRAICIRAMKAKHSRHLIARHRANAARASISLDTFPTVMRTCFPSVPYEENGRDGFFELPNRSEIWVGGLDDKERVDKILGNEYATIALNECSQISYAARNTVMTRLAQNVPGLRQKSLNDLNPVGKSHWTYRLFIQGVDPVNPLRKLTPEEQQRLAFMFINPKDNPTLDPSYLAELNSLPERQRKRFYDGAYVDEVEGALWTLEVLEIGRVDKVPCDLRRIVVAVDPSGAANENDFGSDEIGIVVVGLGVDGECYILKDCSLRAGPGVWGRTAVKAFHDFGADSIIAEQNFGGEMVRFVIQTADRNVPVKVITASRGKVVRAEPVSALYDKKDDHGAPRPRVHHVGEHALLEDQMLAFSTLGYTGEGSPDRVDAAIWGVTELMLPASMGALHLIEHMKNEAQAAKKNAAAVEAAPTAQREPANERETNKVYDLRHKPHQAPEPTVSPVTSSSSMKGSKAPAASVKAKDSTKKTSSFTQALMENQ